MTYVSTPREVIEQCEITCCMVTDDRAIAAVTEGPGGALAAMKPGKILVEMQHDLAPRRPGAGAKVEPTGGAILDAPVSGSQLTVDQGKLLIMVGGDPAAFARAEPVLLDIGPKVRLIGEIGQGKVMKLALNLQLAVQMLEMSEACCSPRKAESRASWLAKWCSAARSARL